MGWGRGRAGGDGEGAARTHGEGHRAEARGAAQGEEGPRHNRATGKTSAGSHRHTHEGGPTTPETPAGPSHPGASPRPGPAARARVRQSPPRATEGPVHPNSTCPSSPDPPSSKSNRRGSRPRETLPSQATRTAPTHRRQLRLAVRAGATRSSWLRDWGIGTSGRPRPLELTTGVTTRTHTRTRGPAPDAGLVGPSPDSEWGGGAGRGRPRAAHGPTAGPAQALPRRRGALPTCSGSRHRGDCTLGRGSSWGVRYPKAPSPIAGEGFLTEGASSPTRRLPFGPTEALHKPPSPRMGGVVGGSAAQVSTRPTGALVATTSAAPRPHTIPPTAQPWEDDRDGAAPGPPPRGETEARLPYRLDPPKRATQGTHHRGGDPRSTLGKGNNTTAQPQAPEGQPGALQGHHQRPSKARSRASRGAQRSGGTAPPPTRGGPLARHMPRRQSESVCCVRGPRTRPRRGAGGRRPKVRAGDHHPCLPHTPRRARRA